MQSSSVEELRRFRPPLGKGAMRTLDMLLDASGVSSSFDRFLEFERRTGFVYTRVKGRLALGYMPNLSAPKSFNEKSIHRRLFSRDPVWPIVTNKIQVRAWLSERRLDQDLAFVPILQIIEDVDRFDFREIQEPVVIKAAWASGLNIFVRDPSAQDWDVTRAQMKKWQAQAYFPRRLVWSETQMKRIYVVERMQANAPGGMLDDYKFYVFHGRVELLQIISGRGSDITYDHYDRDLNPMRDIARRGKKVGKGGKPSPQVASMIPLAERLGEQFDFARVDLYLHNGQVMFGEITQCPVNGFAAFTPVSFDFELGEKWRYDHRSIYESFIRSRAHDCVADVKHRSSPDDLEPGANWG